MQVVSSSELRSAVNTHKTPNLQVNSPSVGGETGNKPIMSSTDIAGLDIDPSDLKLPQFSPHELLERAFVRTLDDGRNFRAKVLRKIQDLDNENYANINFLVDFGDGEIDEIVSYNTLCNLVVELGEDEMQPQDKLLPNVSIEGHKEPLKRDSPDYKGSSYNVLVKWEDGSELYEPLDQLI
jgi:hypothetical protein